MPRSSPEPVAAAGAGRAAASGTLQVFLAEGLLLPTGLVTAAYLSRRLGPEGYGLFTLAATVVAFLSWLAPAAFNRATIQLIGESRDESGVASTMLRLFVGVGVLAALALALGAGPLARLFGEEALRHYLWIFAAELLLVSAVHGHQSILVGTGRFGARAWVSAARWASRLVLIVLAVEAGLSVEGAILGSVAAAGVGLLVCRLSVRPPWVHPQPLPLARALELSAPLIGFGVSMRLFDKLDLFTLKALGASAVVAGHYGAAQNLAIVPALFSMSFSPLLLSSLTRLQREESGSVAARAIARNGLRVMVALVPFAALAAGSAQEIALLVFGSEFAPTGPLLARLIFGALALMVISATTAILTAAGRARTTTAMAIGMLATALLAHLWVIPRFGALGAAWVTTAVAGLGAGYGAFATWRVWGVAAPAASWARSLAVSAGAFAATRLWPAEGAWLVLELGVLALAVPLALGALGELDEGERRLLRGWLRRRRESPAP